jgi:hypothetical protein
MTLTNINSITRTGLTEYIENMAEVITIVEVSIEALKAAVILKVITLEIIIVSIEVKVIIDIT